MRHLSKSFLFASAVTLSLSSWALAAKPIDVIQVSLAGEADQPMKIEVSKNTVKAGTIELQVSNVAIGTDHEMVLVKLTDPTANIVADPKSHRIDEKKLKSMGEVAGLKAGATGKLNVKLAPGEYVLLCNHASHFELGMATHLTVTN